MFREMFIGLALVALITGCQDTGGSVSPGKKELKSALPAEVQIVPEGETQAEGKALPPTIAVCGEKPVLLPGVPGSPGNLIESRINPNGQSELAHTMRLMQKELIANKNRLVAGKPGAKLSIESHGKIRCTWPTVESMRGGAYDPMARQYLQVIENYNNGPLDGEAHNRVVDACITCHQQTCDGPTMAIDAARFTAPPVGTEGESSSGNPL